MSMLAINDDLRIELLELKLKHRSLLSVMRSILSAIETGDVTSPLRDDLIKSILIEAINKYGPDDAKN